MVASWHPLQSINREKDLVVREFNRFSDAEGLRLMQAFFHITEREQRRRVIALAEELASQSGQRVHAVPLPRDNEPTR
jgi:hypothetical protein